MKYFLRISFIKSLFFLLLSISQIRNIQGQTIKNTKLEIVNILKGWTTNYYRDGYLLETNQYEFVDHFFIITNQSYHYSNNNERISDNPKCKTVIDLKYLKSVKYESSPLGGTDGIVFKCVDGYPIKRCDDNITTKSIIKDCSYHTKEDKLLFPQLDWDQIVCERNDEKIKMLNKYFSQLVKSCGGQFINNYPN